MNMLALPPKFVDVLGRLLLEVGSFAKDKGSPSSLVGWKAALLVPFLFMASVSMAQVDVSLSKRIDVSTPSVGQTITYTIIAKNSGILPATGVTVKDSLPTGGAQYLGHTLVRGGTSFTPTTGIWNIGSIAANDSAVLTINARVLAQGVFYNIAEVMSMNQDDQDSWPGDGELDQDDIAVACFSVPLDWYSGDEYVVSVPSRFNSSGIRWFYNGLPINGFINDGSGRRVAEVNSNSTLSILGPGSFTFTAAVGSCPASGCCAIIVRPGPPFDLALSKTLRAGQVSNVNPGDFVTFSLRVTNEGQLAARNIVLSDSLPAGLILADANWTLVGNIATLNTPIAGPLASGASTTVDIRVQVSPTFAGSQLTNYVQIRDARGPNGEILQDGDSSPNNGFLRGEDDDDGETIFISSPCPPIVLTVSSDESICVGESVTLSASNSLSGIKINWYLSAIGGTPFAVTTSGQTLTLSPTSTTVYYLEGELSESCKSVRTPIVVEVNAKPATPTCVDKVTNICPATTVDLTTVTISPITIVGGVFEWRTGPTPSSPLVSNPRSVGAGTYYLFEKSPAGCYSNPMVVTVNIIPCDCQLIASVDAGVDQEVCASEPITVRATLTGSVTSVTWTTSGTGTFSSANSLTATYTPTNADILSGSVTLTATTNDPDGSGLCVPKSDAVFIRINPLPEPAFGVACDDTLICVGNSTKLIGFAPGSTIRWYTTATGGVAIGSTPSGGKLTVSPTVTTIYYAEAVSDKGCVSNLRTPVTVVVERCITDLAVMKSIITPGPYAPGQAITYAVTARNLGPNNATSVTVVDVLPASLSFVSALPSGDYNSTTGIWTIGNLNATSDRTLIINATIRPNASGSITNTAYVRSPDNDPTKTGNDTSRVTIDVRSLADLMLAKKVSNANPSVGQQITYTLEVTNKGPRVATNVEVLDQLPTGIEFVSSTSMSRIGSTLVGVIPSIAVGETRTLSFVARVLNATGSITNIAQINKADQPDPNSTPGNGFNNGEDDEASVTISVGCPIITPPILACAETTICPGESVQITAVGCQGGQVVWSNGATGASITVSPTTNTTYTAVCRVGTCESLISNPITIRVLRPEVPVLTSNVNAVCEGGSATLFASNCSGVVMWSTGQTGASISVTPTVATTYTAYCKLLECESAPASIRIDVTTPGPAPIIECSAMEICPGGSVTFTAHGCDGIVRWSNGATGKTITVSPLVTTTYTARCDVNGCLSQVSEPHAVVVVNPVPPVISANKASICPGEIVTLTATGCTGIVRWSNGVQGASINVAPTSTTSYTAVCQNTACNSSPSNVVVINVGTTAAPFVASSKSVICVGETVTLTATNCTGTVTWSNGMTGASITVSPATTTSYTATCTVGVCASAASAPVTVNVNNGGVAAPTITASKLSICVGESVVLTATNCTGTITWSNGATGASITVNPTATTSYTATCRVGVCSSPASASVTINITTEGTPPVISANKANICVGDSVILTATNCTGTLTWSNGMTGASITVKPTITTSYTATCRVGVCSSPVSSPAVVNVITVGTAPLISASKTILCIGESVVLTATNCSGSVVWSNGMTGASITVSPTVTTTYTANCTGGVCVSPASLPVTVNVRNIPQPEVICTADTICKGESLTLLIDKCAGIGKWSTGELAQAIVISPTVTTTYSVKCVVDGCESVVSKDYVIVVLDIPAPTLTATQTSIDPGQSVTITATGCVGGSVVWSNASMGNSITVTPSVTTTYSAACIVKNCVSDTARITINVNTVCVAPVPTISASAPTVCEGSSVTLTAVGCVGGSVTWSNGMTGTSITTVMNNTTTFTATCMVPNCAPGVSSPITVSVTKLSVPTIATSSKQICVGESVTLTAVGCTGTVVWSNGATGTSITVSPTTSTSYTAKCVLGACESPASVAAVVNVAVPATPNASASVTTVCFGETVTLTASGSCDGFFIWSNGLVGSSITISPAVTTDYSVQCCTSDNCKSAFSTPVRVTVFPKVVRPHTQNLVNTCPFTTVDLTTGVLGSPKTTGGTFVYRTSNNPNSPAVTNPSAVGAGTYYVFERSTNGCFSEAGIIIVTITRCDVTTPCETNPATASAGGDARICASLEYQLNGSIGGSATSAIWTTDGTGRFNDPTRLDAIYYPSLDDMIEGTVRFTLTTNDPDGTGPCTPAVATKTLTIDAIKFRPNIAINGVVKTDTLPTILNICEGDSVVITALDQTTPDAGSYRYKWNNGNSTTSNRFVVRESGTYTVKLVDEKQCCSIESARVVVNVTPAAPRPVVTDKRNLCTPVVDLNSAVLASTGTVEFRIGDSPTSALVASPTTVGAGTYYAFAKSSSGCYSPAAPIKVTIVDCQADTIVTDLLVLKVANKATAQVGEQVQYTVRVENRGTKTATNITVADLLPSSLQFVSGTGFEVQGTALLGKIATLAPNGVAEFTAVTRVLAGGTITNTATITNFDQRDSFMGNNTFSVTINGSAPAHHNMLGVSKVAAEPIEVQNGVYDIAYTISVTNFGQNNLTEVQVKDDLQTAFGSGAVLVPSGLTVSADTGFVVNTNYTGTGANVDLLNAASSTLPVGVTRNIYLNVRIDVNTASTNTFNNTAVAFAKGSADSTVSDASTAGTNPDPDGDEDPTNNVAPTPIVLNNVPGLPRVGVSLAVIDTLSIPDGSFNITYMAIVRNFGGFNLTSVQIVDSLGKVFNTNSGATFKKVGMPIASNMSSLAINPDFDGINDANLLIAANSSLNIGVSDTVRFTINVSTDGRSTPYLNQVVVFAKAGEISVSDVSTNGLSPDLNGNGDPTEATEAVPTPVIIPGGAELFIPEGFSPNGDGINDRFVIRNPSGKKLKLEVYNRWMNLVYKSDDYQNDWDGRENVGLRVGSTANGLPDGTYFYMVHIEGAEKPVVRYFTITR